MKIIKRGAQIGLAGAFLLGAWVLLGLPSRKAVRELATTLPQETSVMRQRDGEAREAGRKPRRLQTTVPLRSISKNLIHAVLSAEDPNFFGHQGIDWDAVAESIETNIEKGRYARGGQHHHPATREESLLHNPQEPHPESPRGDRRLLDGT